MAETSTGHCVMIPVDGSANSERAFKWYTEHFHRPGNRVIIFHCYPAPSLPTFDLSSPGKFPAEQWEKLVTERNKEINDLESQYTTSCMQAKIKFEFKSEMLKGEKPGEAIVHAASNNNVAHIIMGSRGLGKIRRTFMGSVSDYVLHHAGQPVTICPAEK